MAQTETAALEIQGMHCAACVNRVSKALSRLEGVEVRSVEVGSAQIEYDPKRVAPEQLTDAVSRIGFSASLK